MQRVKVLASGKFKFIKNVKGGAKPKAKKTAAKPRGKARRTPSGRRNPRMAKRKSSMVNRVANLVLLLLTFARPIQIMTAQISTQSKIDTLVNEATAGLAKGRFDQAAALRFYTPVAAGFVLFEVKKMAMKKFRF